MKMRLLSTIKNDILLILAGALTGFAALLTVHLLPVEPMRDNAYWSLEMMEKEFEDELAVTGYRSTLTGSFTDSLMLAHAVYQSENHSILEQALYMYRGESYQGTEDGWQPGRSLRDYLNNIPQPREVSYARYWHGYLVILKPLLLLTSFNTIRLFNSALQLFLAGAVVIGMCRRGAPELAKGFLLSLPFLFFVSSYASLSLSICLYLMFASLTAQLRFGPMLLQKNRYGYFFLLTGMAAAYFDFLTYPLITLAFPLCVYLYLDDSGSGAWNAVCRMLGYSVRWLEGYMGLWGMKWVLTDVLVGGSVVRDALQTLADRTGNAEGYNRINGFLSVLYRNIEPYSNWCYVLLGGIGMAMLTAEFMRHGVKRRNFLKIVPYVLLALYPPVWFFAAQNHSEEHWQYTCRIVACSVFALYAGCLKVCDSSAAQNRSCKTANRGHSLSWLEKSQ